MTYAEELIKEEIESMYPVTDDIMQSIKALMSDLLNSDVDYYLTSSHRLKLEKIKARIQALEYRATTG